MSETSNSNETYKTYEKEREQFEKGLREGRPKYILMMISGHSFLPGGPQQILKGLASKATISGYMNDYFLRSDTGRLHFHTTSAALRSVECFGVTAPQLLPSDESAEFHIL